MVNNIEAVGLTKPGLRRAATFPSDSRSLAILVAELSKTPGKLDVGLIVKYNQPLSFQRI